MLKLSKYAALLVAALVLLFCFVTIFSSVETRYECKGNLRFMGETQPKTFYIKLEEYRWWAGLWGDSDASLSVEAPDEWVDHYSHLKKVGNQLQIFDSKKMLAGNFSELSKSLALKTSTGFFDGTCTKVAK